MEKHKQLLDKEYEQLLTQFSKELEKLQLKHQEELGKRLKMNINTEKKLIKEVSQVKRHFCFSCQKPRSDELELCIEICRKYLHPRAMRLNEKPLRQR